jgi:hypothetical protein
MEVEPGAQGMSPIVVRYSLYDVRVMEDDSVSSAPNFKIGEFYSNEDIRTLGGDPVIFLPFKNGEVVAGRFDQRLNPELLGTVLVGYAERVQKAAKMFRGQAWYVPVFVKPLKPPRGEKKWRYEGRYRVSNRVPDPVEDAEEARLATIRLRQEPKVSLVLHLEPDPTP